MKGVARIRQFMDEIRAEMSKVSWPTRQQLLESTGVVLFMTTLLALFFWVWDLFASRLVTLLLR